MKKLLIIRHAKSSWDDPDLRDFDRPLNGRGKKDAPRMGKRLKERNIHPDVMITSPARRASSTCKKIAQELNFAENKIKEDPRLYHASSGQILSVIRSIKDHPGDDEEVALVFGHNPGLTEFANDFLDAEIANIPTCGIVCARLNIVRWEEAKPGCGWLEFFDFPKSKDD